MSRPEQPKNEPQNSAAASPHAPENTVEVTAKGDVTSLDTLKAVPKITENVTKTVNPEDGVTNTSTRSTTLAPEFGGQKGPEPTRYGDWEKNGRCTDF